ncbi:MAG: ankyrin repeat domain-containing protein [Candidatus Tisiphia sp.]
MFKQNYEHTSVTSTTISNQESVGELALQAMMYNKKLADIFYDKDENTIKQIVNQNIHDITLLHYAALVDNQHAVQLLLSYGAKVNVKDKTGSMPIHYATSPNVVRLLIDHGADTNVKDDQGYSILTKACICNNVDLVKILLQNNICSVETKEKTKAYYGIAPGNNDDTLIKITLCGEHGDNLDEV